MSKTAASNLIGNVYKYLTVISRANNRLGKTWWLCSCVCGKYKEVSAANLKSGSTSSCGCERYKSATKTKGDCYIDITGIRFNSLVPINVIRNADGELRWVCLCDCGNTATVYSGHLRAGNIKTCGCGSKGPPKPNLVGIRFGRLTVLSESAPSSTQRGSNWNVLCDCGKLGIMTTGSLRSGSNVSCGCHKTEISTARIKEYISTHKGELHPQWNPNLSTEDRVDRRLGINNASWSREVKIRDKYTCQCCGTVGGKLNSHHLDSYRVHPERRTDLSNGVTLCSKCHKNFHSTYGIKVTYEWQYLEFKENFKTNK